MTAVDSAGDAGRDQSGPVAGAQTGRDLPIRPLAGIAVVAFGVRVLYALTVVRHRVLGYDALWYKTMATTLSGGHGWTVTFPLIPAHDVEPTAKYGPLYPLLLSVPARLGVESATGFRICLAVVGAASVFLIGRLGAALAGRRVGLVAAALAAVYPVLVAGDGSLMSETLYLFWVLLFLNVLATGPSWVSFRRAAILGLLAGLAALTRGEGLLLVPLVFAPWLWAVRTKLKRGLAVLAVATLAVVAVMAPWVVRNYRTFHSFVVTTDDALVIGGANCPTTYHGPLLGSWDLFCLGENRIELAGMDEAERSAVYRSEGVDFATTHKRRLPVVAAARVARTWGVTNGAQRYLEANETRPPTVVDIAWLSYLALVPLVLIGAWQVLRTRRRVALLVGPVVMVSATTLVAYGTERMRYAAEPTVLILAAAAVVWLADRWRARSRPPAHAAPRSPVQDAPQVVVSAARQHHTASTERYGR